MFKSIFKTAGSLLLLLFIVSFIVSFVVIIAVPAVVGATYFIIKNGGNFIKAIGEMTGFMPFENPKNDNDNDNNPPPDNVPPNAENIYLFPQVKTNAVSKIIKKNTLYFVPKINDSQNPDKN